MRRVLLPLLFVTAVLLGAYTFGYSIPMERGAEAIIVYSICTVGVVPMWFLGRLLDNRAWVRHMLRAETKQVLKAEKAFARQATAEATRREAEAEKALEAMKEKPSGSPTTKANGYDDYFGDELSPRGQY